MSESQIKFDGETIHESGDNARMMTSVGKRSYEGPENVPHRSGTKLLESVGDFNSVDKVP